MSHVYKIGDRARIICVMQKKNKCLIGKQLTILNPGLLKNGVAGYDVLIDGEPLLGNDGHPHFFKSDYLEPIQRNDDKQQLESYDNDIQDLVTKQLDAIGSAREVA